MSTIWVSYEGNAAAKGEFYEDASAQGVGDVIVPEGEVSLGERLACGRGSEIAGRLEHSLQHIVPHSSTL